MRVFVTSDLCNVDESELKMIWNGSVSDDDEIFILGNFGSSLKKISFIINNLKGKKGFFIASSDDKIILEYHKMNPPHNNNYRVFGLPFVNMPNGCVLSYWPFFSWDEKNKGKIQYYGQLLSDVNDVTLLYQNNAYCASWLLNKNLLEIKKSYVESE